MILKRWKRNLVETDRQAGVLISSASRRQPRQHAAGLRAKPGGHPAQQPAASAAARAASSASGEAKAEATATRRVKLALLMPADALTRQPRQAAGRLR